MLWRDMFFTLYTHDFPHHLRYITGAARFNRDAKSPAFFVYLIDSIYGFIC